MKTQKKKEILCKNCRFEFFFTFSVLMILLCLSLSGLSSLSLSGLNSFSFFCFWVFVFFFILRIEMMGCLKILTNLSLSHSSKNTMREREGERDSIAPLMLSWWNSGSDSHADHQIFFIFYFWYLKIIINLRSWAFKDQYKICI